MLEAVESGQIVIDPEGRFLLGAGPDSIAISSRQCSSRIVTGDRPEIACARSAAPRAHAIHQPERSGTHARSRRGLGRVLREGPTVLSRA
jgi:hypothetical protein